MKKLELLVIHCTASPEGVKITKEQIKQMHMAPLDNKDGSVTYLCKKYASRADLPNHLINGKFVGVLYGRGWDRLGYSDMIHLDGVVENITPYNDDSWIDPRELTYGASGINSKARHVVYVGGIDENGNVKDTRTQAQLKSLEKYVKDTITKYPKIEVLGHNQVANKACPSFNVPDWLRSIGISEMNLYK